MQFAATLFEYFVTGTIALTWLLPVWTKVIGVQIGLSNIKEGEAIFLIPIAYVLGLFSDSIASIILKVFKDPSRGFHSRSYVCVCVKNHSNSVRKT